MLINEGFDDKFGRIILADIQTPSTTFILAPHIKLVGVSLDDFGWESVCDGIGCTSMFQRVDRVPLGPDFGSGHS